MQVNYSLRYSDMKIRLDWDYDYLDGLDNEYQRDSIKKKNDRDFRNKLKEQKELDKLMEREKISNS